MKDFSIINLLFIILILMAFPAIGQNKELFKTILKGNWAQASYIEDIKKTKSPYKSQNTLAMIVELDFDTSNIYGDSLFVGAPSIHEGTSFYVFFRPGLTKTSFPTNINDENNTNFYELGYEINKSNTTLALYHYNKDKKLLGKVKYIKTPSSSESALQYMVNKTIISGTYNFIDSTGKVKRATFTNDGKVTGLNRYTNYYISTDFIAGPENNIDEIILNLNANNQREYAYIIKGNAIYLYDIKESDNHEELLLGKLKYKFLKK